MRSLAVLPILIVALGLPVAHAQPLSQIYLPLISQPQPDLEVLVTGGGEWIGYPTTVYVYGYVRNNTAQSFYDVMLKVEATIYPYDPIEPPDPYTAWVEFAPALSASLPGQINPFYYSWTFGKGFVSLGTVRVAASSPNSPDGTVYAPLTVVGWTRSDGGQITGAVRNDSVHTLTKARVAILSDCGLHQAALAAESLAPGAVANFSALYSCTSGNIVVAQAAASPAP